MKKEKKKKITIIIIGVILLIAIIIFILNLVKDSKTTEKNMQVIKNSYEELSTSVVEYNQIRTQLAEKLNNFIYENYPKEHEEYTNILTKYNANITNIDKSITNINDKCQVIYKDIAINKICDEYQLLYEKIINLYVADLQNYNNKITSYNEYKEENFDSFELIHTNYIDYNQDKIYEGIDSKNEEN